MPTPRRAAILLTGLAAALAAYSVYAYFLGAINGLPPLPAAWLDPLPDDTPLPAIPENRINQRLREAFGPGCPETGYVAKLEVRSKGYLLAAGPPEVIDGKMLFSPFSLAVVRRKKDGTAEVNTVHADKALLTFDSPVEKFSDMTSRKVVAAELISDPNLPGDDRRIGSVRITNNRSTADPSDDLVLTTPGPILYAADPKPDGPPGVRPPHLRTDSVVEILDLQNMPRPSGDSDLRLVGPGAPEGRLGLDEVNEMLTGKRPPLPTVRARELKVYLTTAASAKEDKPNRGKIGGVESVHLGSRVQMNLWADEDADFLAGKTDPKKKETPEKKDEPKDKDKKKPGRVLVQIETNGPFRYNVGDDVARFEIAELADPSIPNHVVVTRHVGSDTRDTLACDILEVAFDRDDDKPKRAKPEKGPEETTDDGPPLNLRRVDAWGKTVGVTSDTNELSAWCSRLEWEAATQTTVLSGGPVIAMQKDSLVEAKRLILGGSGDSDVREGRVVGPGLIRMDLLDAATQKYARVARFGGELLVKKVRVGDRPAERLTFTGGASFNDAVAEQSLRARTIRLWLFDRKDDKKPKEDKKKKTDKKDKNEKKKDNGPGKRLHRVEADGDVTVDSGDLQVNRADSMTVRFRDVLEDEMPPKPKPPEKKKDAPEPAGPPQPAPKKPQPKPKPRPEPEPEPERDPDALPRHSPLRVHTGSLEVWVKRHRDRTLTERVVCKAGPSPVVVEQAPTEDQPGGVHITGRELELNQHLDGDVLVVTGSARRFARVHLDKITLTGLRVHIDRRDNLARVRGAGAMDMVSESDLQGRKLKAPTRLRTYWRDGMEFRGAEKWARFDGRVQAQQLGTRVLCESMTVTFDRPVWFNQVGKSAPDPESPESKGRAKGSPKVDVVVCDQRPADGPLPARLPPVTLFEERFAGGKRIGLQRLQTPAVKMDNADQELLAAGPGTLRLLQRSASQAGERRSTDAPEAKTETKLTYVRYRDRMRAGDKDKHATFYGDVEVLSFPSEELDADIHAARLRLPEGALHLKCQRRLDVYTRTDADGRDWQMLHARGDVVVRSGSENFRGRAETVKYDSEKEMIVFEGSRDNPARLFTRSSRGQGFQEVKGVRVTYNRRTGDVSADRVSGISGSSR